MVAQKRPRGDGAVLSSGDTGAASYPIDLTGNITAFLRARSKSC